MLFCVWEDSRVWVPLNHSLDTHLNCLGPVSCVFSSRVSSGLSVGGDCSLMAARQQVLPSCVPSGLTSSPSVGAAIRDDCASPCLLMWQEIYHFSMCVYVYAFLYIDIDMCMCVCVCYGIKLGSACSGVVRPVCWHWVVVRASAAFVAWHPHCLGLSVEAWVWVPRTQTPSWLSGQNF